MADEDDKKKLPEGAIETAGVHEPGLSPSEVVDKIAVVEAPEGEFDDAPAAAQLGAARYVMAGFFASAIGVAYVLGRLLSGIWGSMVEAPWFQKHLMLLASVDEDVRAEYCTIVGGIIGIAGAVYAYRRPDVREWTDDVATELSKVSWPDKSEVTNSTVVVLVTSAFATLYLALLDRFWSFVTNLVYGS